MFILLVCKWAFKECCKYFWRYWISQLSSIFYGVFICALKNLITDCVVSIEIPKESCDMLVSFLSVELIQRCFLFKSLLKSQMSKVSKVKKSSHSLVKVSTYNGLSSCVVPSISWFLWWWSTVQYSLLHPACSRGWFSSKVLVHLALKTLEKTIWQWAKKGR